MRLLTKSSASVVVIIPAGVVAVPTARFAELPALGLALAEALGLVEAEGLREALGEREALGDTEADAEGETLAEGL
jgi:hypothetical protein